MTSHKLYNLIKDVMPPIIFREIKKSSLYSVIAQGVKKISGSEYKPSWNTINDGFLKGYSFFCDKKGGWQSEMLNGIYDKFLFSYVGTLDLKSKTIFDIGTHVGYHSLYFSKLAGKNGRVYAFEPNTFNIERIKLNLSKNESVKNIYLKEVAVSDQIGEEEFLFSGNIESGTSSGGFLDTSDPLWKKEVYINETGFNKVKVKTVTLDSLIEENLKNRPTLLKIDVEGAENLIMKGGMKFLSEYKPIILMEVHSIFNMFEVMNALNELGYKTKLLKKENDGRCFLASEFKN